MSRLRIEFFAEPPEGTSASPYQGVTLDATAEPSQITAVPAHLGGGAVHALFTAASEPLYVSCAENPDPSSDENRFVVVPGTPVIRRLSSVLRISCETADEMQGLSGNVTVTQQNGSTGHDFSANPETLDSSWLLIATLPANDSRAEWSVQNRSTDQVRVMLDDGQGAQVSILTLNPAPDTYAAGDSLGDQSFKGRAKIYSQSASSPVSLRET